MLQSPPDAPEAPPRERRIAEWPRAGTPCHSTTIALPAVRPVFTMPTDESRRMKIARAALAGYVLVGLLATPVAWAGPWIAPGDSALRHDLQLLGDAGVIRAPLTTWPLSWGDIAGSLQATADLSPDEAAALERVERRLQQASESGILRFSGEVSLAGNARTIRTFEDGPREDAMVGAGLSYTGNWFAMNLEGQYVDDPQDGKNWRGDGSYLGIALGNWMFAGAITDRWWGPGWNGSLILGSNARPIPAFTIERNGTEAFETPWLSWLGDWDFAALWGFLDDALDPPNSRFFAMRFAFRPLQSLEIGLSRTAQWCGSGRPCDFDTFVDVLLGKDNKGENVSAEDEPGNQLGGFDLRWSGRLLSRPLALYGQLIGEDENSYWPTQWLGQFGAETTGYVQGFGSWRVFFEWADTECDFHLYRSIRGDDGPGDHNPNCAYNHPLYKGGYRYRDLSIGHSFDNDASVFTLGGMLMDNEDRSWLTTVAYGNLNRHGTPDARNSVAIQKTRYREIEVSHRRVFFGGELDLGAGYDSREDTITDDSEDDVRVFARWRYVF
jgi:hypothetical protein